MTPEALDKWSKKRAEEFSRDVYVEGEGKYAFLAGMAAAQEVYGLIEQVRALKAIEFIYRGQTCPMDIVEFYDECKGAETKLKAPLGAEVE